MDLVVCLSLVLPQQDDDLLELLPGGDVERRLSVLVSNPSFNVSFQQQRNQTMVLPLTDVVKSCVSSIVDCVDVHFTAQHCLHHSHVSSVFLQHEEVSEEQDGHQDGDHEIIQQREASL